MLGFQKKTIKKEVSPPIDIVRKGYNGFCEAKIKHNFVGYLYICAP